MDVSRIADILFLCRSWLSVSCVSKQCDFLWTYYNAASQHIFASVRDNPVTLTWSWSDAPVSTRFFFSPGFEKQVLDWYPIYSVRIARWIQPSVGLNDSSHEAAPLPPASIVSIAYLKPCMLFLESCLANCCILAISPCSSPTPRTSPITEPDQTPYM